MSKGQGYRKLVRTHHRHDYGKALSFFIATIMDKLRKQGATPRQCSDRLHHQIENALLYDIKREE